MDWVDHPIKTDAGEVGDTRLVRRGTTMGWRQGEAPNLWLPMGLWDCEAHKFGVGDINGVDLMLED